MNEIGTDLPVMAMATPVSDMIPAPIICPIAWLIRSQNPRTLLRSLVEELAVSIMVNSF
jgi:hypothetical protein